MFRRLTFWRGEMNLIGQFFLFDSPGMILPPVLIRAFTAEWVQKSLTIYNQKFIVR